MYFKRFAFARKRVIKTYGPDFIFLGQKKMNRKHHNQVIARNHCCSIYTILIPGQGSWGIETKLDMCPKYTNVPALCSLPTRQQLQNAQSDLLYSLP